MFYDSYAVLALWTTFFLHQEAGICSQTCGLAIIRADKARSATADRTESPRAARQRDIGGIQHQKRREGWKRRRGTIEGWTRKHSETLPVTKEQTFPPGDNANILVPVGKQLPLATLPT